MGLGISAANGLANWEEKLQEDVERHRKEDAETNKRRFRGTFPYFCSVLYPVYTQDFEDLS
jgi:hypothetical protein